MITIALTEEQAEFYRFVMDNHERIKYLKRKKMFDYKNGSIKINYKPTGEIQNFEYYQVDNEK